MNELNNYNGVNRTAHGYTGSVNYTIYLFYSNPFQGLPLNLSSINHSNMLIHIWYISAVSTIILKKFRILETPTLSTDADSRTNTNLKRFRDFFVYFFLLQYVALLNMFFVLFPPPLFSISRNVRLSVCPSVCPSVRLSVYSLLRYRLNVFLPPLSKVGCPIFLEIWNPWGKVMYRSGLRFEHFFFKVV